MVKYLGIDTDCHVCDCCGKGNLKKTVALDFDGEVQYYGTVCAGKALGYKTKTPAEVKAAVSAVNARQDIENKVTERRARGENVVYGRFYINSRSIKSTLTIAEPSDLMIRQIFPKKGI